MHDHIRILFLSIILSSCLAVYGQNNNLEGYIVDESSGKALPFAHVYLKNKPAVVSTSNQAGFFSIQCEKSDTLVASFIGYQKAYFPVSEFSNELRIALQPYSIELSTIEIVDESDFLYHLLSRSRKTEAYYSKSAKSYLFLESAIDGKTTEMIEAYYNGRFKGYDLQELQLKNGRIGLQDYNQQFFINMHSSRAVMMHSLMNKNEYFPEDPLGSSKRRIKKLFELAYQNRFIDEEGRVVYQIDFKPRKENRSSFEGSVWIDSASANIQKIEMEAKNTIKHPFLPLFPDAKIERIDLFIRKTFVEIKGLAYPREIDFNYTLDYRKNNNERISIHTNSLLYALDYGEKFNLPHFQFPLGLENDYRKINALPQNQFFWQHKPFTFGDEDGLIEYYFNNDSTLLANDLIYRDGADPKRSFFEHPYVIWRGNRIRMRDMERSPENRMTVPKGKENFASTELNITIDSYNLEVQLFMDIYPYGDSLNFVTAAIFDPYESYYYKAHDLASVVFLNIYFDLAEIQNRKLTLALKGVNRIADAEAIHQSVEREFKEISKAYFNEVQRGQNFDALKSWNDLVLKEIGIDNIELFKLKDEE